MEGATGDLALLPTPTKICLKVQDSGQEEKTHLPGGLAHVGHCAHTGRDATPPYPHDSPHYQPHVHMGKPKPRETSNLPKVPLLAS